MVERKSNAWGQFWDPIELRLAKLVGPVGHLCVHCPLETNLFCSPTMQSPVASGLL